MSQKKLSRVFLMITGLFMLTAACGLSGSAKTTPTPLPPLTTYEKTIYTVERGPIVSEKSTIAEVVPSRQDELYFRASGYITRVTVKDGNTIKAGELLAEMQVDDLLNQLEQARIDLEVSQTSLARYQSDRKYAITRAEIDVKIAQARVELAKLDLKNAASPNARIQADFSLSINEANLELSKLALEQAKEDISSYEAQAVQRSQLAVNRLEALIAERQIVAPYDCIILKSRLREGTSVEAYQNAFVVGDPAELLVRLPMDRDLRDILTKESEIRMYLTADVEESINLQFIPNFLPITASEESTTAQAEYLYFALPEAMRTDAELMDRSVKLIMVLGRKDDALLLPPAAIRNYRGLNFVVVIEGEKRRRVEIYEIGLKTADRWEVISDLNEGDQVLGP